MSETESSEKTESSEEATSSPSSTSSSSSSSSSASANAKRKAPRKKDAAAVTTIGGQKFATAELGSGLLQWVVQQECFKPTEKEAAVLKVCAPDEPEQSEPAADQPAGEPKQPAPAAAAAVVEDLQQQPAAAAAPAADAQALPAPVPPPTAPVVIAPVVAPCSPQSASPPAASSPAYEQRSPSPVTSVSSPDSGRVHHRRRSSIAKFKEQLKQGAHKIGDALGTAERSLSSKVLRRRSLYSSRSSSEAEEDAAHSPAPAEAPVSAPVTPGRSGSALNVRPPPPALPPQPADAPVPAPAGQPMPYAFKAVESQERLATHGRSASQPAGMTAPHVRPGKPLPPPPPAALRQQQQIATS